MQGLLQLVSFGIIEAQVIWRYSQRYIYRQQEIYRHSRRKAHYSAL